MSVNRDKPHVLILPEDDANRQIAKRFQLELDWLVQRRVQVLNPAGGWSKLLDNFESDHAASMDRYCQRRMVLLIDFDGDIGRLEYSKSKIPARLAGRVFVLGALSEPEKLRKAGLGTYEQIGAKLAADCRDGRSATWGHDLLKHNSSELDRLREHVRPILFDQADSSLAGA